MAVGVRICRAYEPSYIGNPRLRSGGKECEPIGGTPADNRVQSSLTEAMPYRASHRHIATIHDNF